MWYVFPQKGSKWAIFPVVVSLAGPMLYVGTYELSIDPKNRLSIPAGIKSRMDPQEDGKAFYSCPGYWKSTLDLWAENRFHRFAAERHASLEPGEELDIFVTVFYARATLLEVDKQRRVVLPQWMLDMARIGKRVILTGAQDHLVLWDRPAFDQFMQENGSRWKDLLRVAQLRTQVARQSAGTGSGMGAGGSIR